MTLKIDKLKIFFRSRSRSLNGDSASQLGESSSSYPEAISVTIPEGDSQAAVLSQGKVQKKTCTQDTRLPGGVATASSRQMNDKMWAEAHSHLSEKEQEVIARLLAADKSVSDWTPENLLWDIQAKREICDKKRWTFKCGDHTIQLRDTADKVLDWLDKFKAAGDIVSNVDPLHAGVPWAGIRFLIQVVQSERNQMEALFRGLNRICYILYRCRLYEGLLQSSQSSSQARQNLQLALTEFYTVTLRFLAQAAHAYERSSLQRAFTAFWSSDDIQGLENQCQDLETRAEIEAQSCERSESSKARKLLLELPMIKDLTDSMYYMVTTIWGDLQEKEVGDILKWISRIPYEDHHKSVCKGRTANTGGWLFEHAQYQKWQLSEKSTILWLHGIPGAGKTKLISRVIDHLTKHQPNTTVAYFYCNRYEASRRDPTHILQSYVKQLSKSPSDGAIQQVLVDVYKENQRKGGASAKLSFEESESLVLELARAYSETILILDALDESYVEDREDLMEALDRLVSQSANIKILISSRRDNNIKRRLKLEINLGIEATDNRDDISKFVHEKIQRAQQGQHRNKPISEGLRDEIVTTLLDKSEGMFQWAALQIKEILELQLEKDIQKRLGRLPKGLQAAYSDIFKKRITSSAGSLPEIANRAFQWVLFSFEPLHSDALVAFVSRDMEDGKIEHVDLNIHDVLDACCNLLEVDKHSELCGFSHLSVQEYLEEHHYQADKFATNASSHCGLATVTIQCLLEKNIEMANEKLAEASSLTYAAKYWHLHARKSYKVNISEGLKGYISMIFSKEFSPTYSNWLRIQNCEEGDSVNDPPAMCFQHVDGGFPGRLYCASRFGFEFIVEKLLREDAQMTREASLRSHIVAAAIHCHSGVLRQLIDAHVPRTIQQEDLCCIMKNIDGDITETMMVLLDSGALHHEEEKHSPRQNPTERTAKENAITAAARNARNGDKVIAILLKKWGAGISITDDVVKTAAGNSESGDKIMAILLQERGDDIPITEAVVKVAVGNKNCGDRLMKALLRYRTDIPITEDVIEEAARNSSKRTEIMSILLEERGADLPMTENLVAQLAERLNERMITMLLNKRGADIPITENVVEAAARNYSSGEETMAILLEERGADIPITEGLVARIAESFTERVMMILLNKRGADILITEEVIKAAAGNIKSGDKIMTVLLEDGKADILITEGLVAEIAESFSERVMMILLDKRGADILITENVVKAAARNKSGDEVMAILLDKRGADIRITEDVVEAAARNKSGDEVMAILLDKRGADIPITERIIKAVAENYSSGKEMMTILLDKRGNDILITEDVIKAAAGNYWIADMVMTVLLEKRGGEVLITEDVMKTAAENENCRDRLMTTFLRHKADIRTIVDVVEVTEGNQSSTSSDHDSRLIPGHFDTAHSLSEMTLRLTPQAMNEPTMNQNETPTEIFHNYLRAFYPFRPAGDAHFSTVTIPLNQGDIILVHALHTNGWADGTILDSGQRGWVPTNYCETYDHLPMYPLLKATTDSWKSIQNACLSCKNFGSQDLLRGANAGVRFLLEKSECLTPEASLVMEYDVLRATRKSLFSDLLSLSMTTRKFQDVVDGDPSEEVLEVILDEMLLKAFKVVTRGARFLDIWNELSLIGSIVGKSSSGPSAAICVQGLASARLGTMYDEFLSLLGSLLGLHMQSRSSTKLILIIKQAVESCQALLNVVKSVYEHDTQRGAFLEQARDSMCDKLSALVHAARDAIRPAHFPDEYTRLLHAATDCVRAAANCLAKSHLVLEKIGDFDFNPSDHETTQQGVTNPLAKCDVNKNDPLQKTQPIS